MSTVQETLLYGRECPGDHTIRYAQVGIYRQMPCRAIQPSREAKVEKIAKPSA